MDRVFMTRIEVERVRHLSGVDIRVADEDGLPRHLILTGKNGSGKTSLLRAIAGYIDALSAEFYPARCEKSLQTAIQNRDRGFAASPYEADKSVGYWQQQLDEARHGVRISFNVAEEDAHVAYESNECILDFFEAHRTFEADIPTQVEKVIFPDRYKAGDSPRRLFIKYMLDLKVTQALSESAGDRQKADEIARWFDKVQGILRDIYEDDGLTIEFDVDSYSFFIRQAGRDPFDFNSSSDGFSAVLDVIVGIMLRMAGGNYRMLDFDKPGIVLIDEVENHLHLSLQKRVLPYLAELFPNVQFIVSTHSPFVLSSMADAIVYDLETHAFVEDGLADNTYGSIVEGYFNVDGLSNELRSKYDRYKALVSRGVLADDDLAEAAELEVYLDEIPDYLALDIATEYKKLKLQIRAKASSDD